LYMGVFKAAVQEPLFKNSVAILLNTVSAGLFGLLFWIVAARNFPIIEIGLASAAISVIQFTSNISMGGADNALIRFLPQSDDKKGIFTALFALMAATSLLLSLFALFSLNFFAPALAFLQGGLFAFVFVACAMITAISPYLTVALIALRRSDLALATTLASGSRVIVLIILSSIGMLGIFVSFLVGYVICCILALVLLYYFGITFIRRIPPLPYKDIIHFGLGTYIAGILASVPIALVPLMIIQTIGAEQNAFFFIAYNVAIITSVASSAVAMSLFVEGSHGVPLR
jgi:O-antigen/teichoic acid export membrane protein